MNRGRDNLSTKGGGVATHSLLNIFTHHVIENLGIEQIKNKMKIKFHTRSPPDMFLLALPLVRSSPVLVQIVLTMAGATVAG